MPQSKHHVRNASQLQAEEKSVSSCAASSPDWPWSNKIHRHCAASYPRFQEDCSSESYINLQHKDQTKHSRMEALNLWPGISHYFISHPFLLLRLNTGFNRRNFWIGNLFLLNFFLIVTAVTKQWTFAIKYGEALKIAIMCILILCFFL